MQGIIIRVKPFSDDEVKLYERWKQKWKHNKPGIYLGVPYGIDENTYIFDNISDCDEMYEDLSSILDGCYVAKIM